MMAKTVRVAVMRVAEVRVAEAVLTGRAEEGKGLVGVGMARAVVVTVLERMVTATAMPVELLEVAAKMGRVAVIMVDEVAGSPASPQHGTLAHGSAKAVFQAPS